MSQGAAVCDGSGTSTWCTTKGRHAHCICGLPMDKDARMCPQCHREGLCPSKSYPSYRLRRTQAPDPITYVALLWAVNNFPRLYPQRYAKFPDE